MTSVTSHCVHSDSPTCHTTSLTTPTVTLPPMCHMTSIMSHHVHSDPPTYVSHDQSMSHHTHSDPPTHLKDDPFTVRDLGAGRMKRRELHNTGYEYHYEHSRLETLFWHLDSGWVRRDPQFHTVKQWTWVCVKLDCLFSWGIDRQQYRQILCPWGVYRSRNVNYDIHQFVHQLWSLPIFSIWHLAGNSLFSGSIPSLWPCVT